MFCKKSSLQIFTKFTVKHLRWSSFFGKVSALNQNLYWTKGQLWKATYDVSTSTVIHLKDHSWIWGNFWLQLEALYEAVVQRCSIKKVLLEILQNSQKNTCARAPFLIKLQALPWNFIKKETLAQMFLCEFCEFLRRPFLTEHLRWLLLVLYKCCAMLLILFQKFFLVLIFKFLSLFYGDVGKELDKTVYVI